MPKMDGFEFFRKVKEKRKSCAISTAVVILY
jgi:CheY-like chemotaxis protein